MRAFDISLNGNRLCCVGIGNDGVLSTAINYVSFGKRRETRLYVGGLLMPQNEPVFWKTSTLRVGDELWLKIVELTALASQSDAGITRLQPLPAHAAASHIL